MPLKNRTSSLYQNVIDGSSICRLIIIILFLYSPIDPYWHQVNMFYLQVFGLTKGVRLKSKEEFRKLGTTIITYFSTPYVKKT